LLLPVLALWILQLARFRECRMVAVDADAIAATDAIAAIDALGAGGTVAVPWGSAVPLYLRVPCCFLPDLRGRLP